MSEHNPTPAAQERERIRTLVVRIADAARRDEPGVLAGAGHPGIRWWLPTGPEWVHGPGAVDAALRALLRGAAGTAGPVVPEAVLVSTDARLAVLELPALPVGGARTPVTMVVEFLDGRVIEGRTYADVPATGGGAAP